MQIYTVGADLKLTPASNGNNEKLKIGEQVSFFDKRRMGQNIAEVVPTKNDNLKAYERVEVGKFYSAYFYFPSIEGEEKFTGTLISKKLIDNEYPVFWFQDTYGKARIVSTSDMCVLLTRIEEPK